MLNSQDKLITYRCDNGTVTVGHASKKMLQKHEEIMRNKLKTSNIKAEYSTIKDLSLHSVQPSIELFGGEKFFKGLFY